MTLAYVALAAALTLTLTAILQAKLVYKFGTLQNQLSGSIPTELGNLVKLSSGFALLQNSFSSSIPTQLGNLQEMTGADKERSFVAPLRSFGFMKPRQHTPIVTHALLRRDVIPVRQLSEFSDTDRVGPLEEDDGPVELVLKLSLPYRAFRARLPFSGQPVSG